MIKEKKCKGQGKAFGFVSCGKLVNVAYRKFGLCTSCYAAFIMDTDAGKLLLSKALTKAKVTVTKANKAKLSAERKDRKEKSISYSKRLQKARAVFQAAIRRRDVKEPCPSCGSFTKKKWDAGHYYKAELYSNVIFDEENVHKQCVYCNRDLAGNLIEYRKGLVARIGAERVQKLEERAKKSSAHTYSNEFFEEIIKKYKKMWL